MNVAQPPAPGTTRAAVQLQQHMRTLTPGNLRPSPGGVKGYVTNPGVSPSILLKEGLLAAQ